MLFSVIVPIYNVQKYLNRCIDSVLSQTFQDYELILVDDGSLDECGAICDEYAKKDKRITVIHKDFMKYYEVHCADDTKPYEGIIDAIRHLRSLGYKTAVVSNKAHPAVLELCDQYFPGLFDLAIGERPNVARKPAPDMVHMALNHFNVSKENAVYIGDSDVDVATARNSELDMIAVDWGFRSRECLMEQGATTIISKPEEIVKYV